MDLIQISELFALMHAIIGSGEKFFHIRNERERL